LTVAVLIPLVLIFPFGFYLDIGALPPPGKFKEVFAKRELS